MGCLVKNRASLSYSQSLLSSRVGRYLAEQRSKGWYVRGLQGEQAGLPIEKNAARWGLSMSERSTVADTTDYQAIRNSTLHIRRIRQSVTVISLALADVGAFALSAALFRANHFVPRLLLYHGLLPTDTPIDIFYIFGAVFIAVRYLSGDYSRRQLFWDGTRLTTIGLLVAATPCFLLLLFVDAHYSAFAEICSWLFVILAVPAFRHLVRFLLSRASLWRLPTALIGDGPNALEAFDAFGKSLSLGFDVRFLIALDDLPKTTKDLSGVTCIGLRDPANIMQRLTEAGCHEVVVATEHQLDTETDALIQRALAAGMGVALIPPLRRLPLLGLTVNYFFGQDLLLMQVRNNLGRLPSRLLKRFIDLIGSAVLLSFSRRFLP